MDGRIARRIATGGLVALVALKLGASTVDVAAYGVRPDTGENMTPAISRMLAACTNGGERIVLPAGRYLFRPDRPGERTTAFLIRGVRGLTLDGNGATLIFHGLMNPFRLVDSRQIEVRNLSIDWERPFITQGTIRSVTDQGLFIWPHPDRVTIESTAACLAWLASMKALMFRDSVCALKYSRAQREMANDATTEGSLLRVLSSRAQASLRQWFLFSMPQWPRTRAAQAAGVLAP